VISAIMQSMPFLLQGALYTISIAATAMVLGLCGGIICGILNCQKLRTPIISLCINSFVWIIRGTPLFAQLLIVYYALPEALGIPLSPFMAGVIALGFNSIAYISEIVRGGVNSISGGQWDAAYVLGVAPWRTLRDIIIPQMLRITLPSLTNELTALIKETSILSMIGVAELTKISRDIVARELNPMTIYLVAAVFYLIMTSVIAFITHTAQKRSHL